MPWESCAIRLHGFLSVEENSKRKVKSYCGKDYARIAFEGLDCGDFARLHRRKLDIISVHEFKAKHKPRQVFNFQEPETEDDYTTRLEESLQKQQRRRKGFLEKLLNPF